MFRLLYEGGPFMWPILVMAIAIIMLAAKKALELYGKGGLSEVRLEKGLNPILFWGGMSAVIGLLGSFHGLYLAAGYIEHVKDHTVPAMWAGIQVASMTTIFGLLVFTFAALVWFILRSRFKRLIQRTA